MAEDACTIVAYEVHGEDCDKFLNAWKEADSHLQKQKSHISTTLHQSASAKLEAYPIHASVYEVIET